MSNAHDPGDEDEVPPPERMYFAIDLDGCVTILTVQPSWSAALLAVSDQCDEAEFVEFRRLSPERAANQRVRDDDDPARARLTDAAMGAIYSSEV